MAEPRIKFTPEEIINYEKTRSRDKILPSQKKDTYNKPHGEEKIVYPPYTSRTNSEDASLRRIVIGVTGALAFSFAVGAFISLSTLSHEKNREPAEKAMIEQKIDEQARIKQAEAEQEKVEQAKAEQARIERLRETSPIEYVLAKVKGQLEEGSTEIFFVSDYAITCHQQISADTYKINSRSDIVVLRRSLDVKDAYEGRLFSGRQGISVKTHRELQPTNKVGMPDYIVEQDSQISPLDPNNGGPCNFIN